MGKFESSTKGQSTETHLRGETLLTRTIGNKLSAPQKVDMVTMSGLS
jgi:hypothetical protein